MIKPIVLFILCVVVILLSFFAGVVSERDKNLELSRLTDGEIAPVLISRYKCEKISSKVRDRLKKLELNGRKNIVFNIDFRESCIFSYSIDGYSDQVGVGMLQDYDDIYVLRFVSYVDSDFMETWDSSYEVVIFKISDYQWRVYTDFVGDVFDSNYRRDKHVDMQ
ncbi:hypothetical protein [Teredinibacter sp. KSP-S5-2]|uniref:hypothetical protein n=1 Tax=Teredinibacter sp. KSP-S5-2 TaxID=3034506 RepID=UPI002934DD34|nr:hypothetical protein [Teredinibacter sp. KSP-S5-2]WNO10578.1 hypothetical protein P5V12_05265 [Teredinibacter sp. KSP-S5-2]